MYKKGLPDATPIPDISGLKVKGVRTLDELFPLEAENVREAVVRYLAAKPSRRVAPFTLSWVKRLHKQMLGKVWRWAGQFRTENVSIGMDYWHIETSAHALLEDLKYWQESGIDLQEQAVWLHHRAVHIHPFPDGNGRWSRLLANIWLKQHGSPPVDWPDATIRSVSTLRDEYIAAIQRADAGDYDPLAELHRKFTPAS